MPNEDCPDDQCTKRHYEYSKSRMYRDSGKIETVKYGMGEIEGNVVTDDVALTKSTRFQAQQVNLLSVYKAIELDSLESDGLLGLSPKTMKYGRSGEELHLLVTELKKDKVMKKAMFAIYLATRNI